METLDRIVSALEAANTAGVMPQAIELTARDLRDLGQLSGAVELFGMTVKRGDESAVLYRRPHGKFECVPWTRYPLPPKADQ